MKRFLIPIFIFSVYSCSNSQKREIIQESIQEHHTTDSLINTEVLKNVKGLTFKETIGQAVLIGDKIELLDENLKTIDDISNLTGNIAGISLLTIKNSLPIFVTQSSS